MVSSEGFEGFELRPNDEREAALLEITLTGRKRCCKASKAGMSLAY